MKLSARNVLKGKVIKIVKGAVNSEVTLELSEGVQVVSIITNQSVASLKLKKNAECLKLKQNVSLQMNVIMVVVMTQKKELALREALKKIA